MPSRTRPASPDTTPASIVSSSVRLRGRSFDRSGDIGAGDVPPIEFANQRQQLIEGLAVSRGAGAILKQMAEGGARRRVGLLPEGRAQVRAGVQLFETGASAQAVGRVTSGGFGPTLGGPVAMGYVPASQAAEGSSSFADLRGSRVALRVAKTPFIAPGYKRG